MNLKNLFILLFIIYQSVGSTTIYAQEKLNRFKIGLVLSGGGAKGFAHIGVLKEIEKAGIKIDYIGGTSMGAIIGALYASGLNATQLDSIFKQTNFEDLIQDLIPRNNKSFYEKENEVIYALSLPVEKFKITIPRGVSNGINNYNLLSKLLHPVRHIKNFDELKIPFLCIATDLETGKEVVFRNGNLPLVLAASGAFPSLLSPVEIDGRLYIDGGVTNNYPIEEVRKMGADIIIGVDVQDGLKDRTRINGALDVLNQISSFQMLDKMKQKIADTDIYIKPNIKGYSVISFDLAHELVDLGAEASFLGEEQLKELGTNYKKPPLNLKTSDSIDIKNLQVNGNVNYTNSYVFGKLRLKPNHKISHSFLENGIRNLNATQNFNKIYYHFKKNENKDDLVLDVVENPFKTYFKLGLHYNNLLKTGLLINLTKRKVFSKNDVASFDLVLGDNIRYNFDYYIDNGFHWSFGFNSKLNQFEKYVKTDFKGGKFLKTFNLSSLNIDYLEVTNQVYLQTIFVQKFLIGGGLEHKHLNINTNSVLDSKTLLENSNYYSVIGFMKYDSFNNKFFPSEGWYFNGDVQSVLSSSNFNNNFKRFSIFKADMGKAFKIVKNLSLKLQSEGGFIIGSKGNSPFDFILGGYGFHKINNLRPFYGYHFLDLNGNSYIKGSFNLDYKFAKKHHLNFEANYANIGNNLFEKTENWISIPNFSGYALGYAMESRIGPLEIKHSWSPETNKFHIWIALGFRF